MLFLGFNIESPFDVAFYNCWHWYKSKGDWCIESQLVRTNILIKVSIRIHGPKEDHTGVELSLGLFGYDFDLLVYNAKHAHMEEELESP